MSDGKVVIETEIDNSGAEEDLKKLEREIKSSTEKSADRISRLTEKLNQEVKNGTRSVMSAASVLAQEYKKSGDNASDAYKKAWSQIERASKLGSKEAQDAIDDIGHTATKNASHIREKLGNALSKLGHLAQIGLKTTMAAITGAGAAFAGLGGAAVKVGMDFEAGMSEVQAISRASAEEMEQLTAKAKEMGAKTKFSASESAQAFQYMAQAGWETQDMLDGIEGVMSLAAASGEDLALTSDIVTDALTAFGLEAKDAAHFSDVLAMTANATNTNVANLGYTFKYVAPVAGALGYSIEDMSVAIGLMANQGIKAETAGTALRGMLTNLAKPTDQVAEYMNALGISMTDTAGNVKPLNQLLVEMRGAFSELTDAQKAEYAAGLAGKEAMTGLLAIVNASDEEFAKLTEQINNCNGAAQQTAEIMQDNLKGRIEQLGGALETLGIQFYESVDTPLKTIVENATGMVEQLSKAFEKDGLSGLVAEFGDVLSQVAVHAAKSAPKMMEAGTDMILAFLDGIQKNSKQISSAMVEIGKAMLSAIVQIVPKVAAIGKELIVGFVNAILGANAAKSVGQMIDSILAAFQSLLQSAQKVWNALKPILSGLVQVISNLAQVILPVFTGAIQLLADHAQALIPIVTAAAGAFAAFKILSTVTTIINTAKTAYVAFQAVLSATNPIMLVIGALGGLAALLTGVFCSSADEATAAAERLEESQKALGERMVEIGDDIQEFREGVANAGSILDDLNSSVVVSAEEQQKLSSRMAEVQEEISQIAGTYSEGRKQLTQQEIEKLDQLFQEMQSLAKRELEIQKSYMDVTESMASSLVNNQSLTLEEYNKQRDYIIHSAEDTKNQVIAKVQEQARQEIALLQSTGKAKQDEIDAVYALMNEEIKKAEDKEQEILGIVQGGYTDRADAFSEFVKKSAELEREYTQNTEENNQQIALLEQERVKENSGFWGSIFQNGNRHNQKIKELQTENENQTAAYNERIKELWNDEVQAQAAAHLEMAANQLESNGKITGEAALMVQEILKTYDQMGEEQKKSFAEACGGSLDTILEHRPGIEQAARELGENTVQSVEDGMEEKEPSLLSQTKQLSESVLNQLEGSPQKASVIGSNIALGLIQGMNNQKKSVQATAANLANIAYQAMQVVLDIHSPSRIMRDKIGKNIALGVADGIDKNAKAAAKSAEDLSTRIVGASKQQLGQLRNFDIGLSVSRLRSAVAMETGGVSATAGSVATYQAAMASPVSAQSAASVPVQTVDTVEAHIYVDSREAAVALVPAISKELGWKGNR